MIFCRALFRSGGVLRHTLRPSALLHTSARLAFVQESSTPVSKSMSIEDIEAALDSKPTWTIESLLPPEYDANDAKDEAGAPKITTSQLHHLLRLSALPMPKSQEEENRMLSTLSDQLHFVGKIQEVDTMGVEPLRVIRDETAAAEQEQTVTLETLQDALAKEKVVGKHYKRIQRDTTPVDASDVENWDVLGSAEKKLGRYFVVESERAQE